MPVERARIYWDACVFLHYLQQTPDWYSSIEGVVDEVRNGQTLIVTSALSMAEVAYVESERAGGLLDPGAFTAIDDMWADSAMVLVVEVSPNIALEARKIIRRGKNEGRSLSASDAIHLATAVQQNVVDFHTMDDKLRRWNGEWFPVRPPVALQPASERRRSSPGHRPS